MTFDELKEKAHSLPLKPGVYIMQNAQSEVIYVGKAKALKNRVSQYFANLAAHTEKTRAMVSQIDHFDVIIADSEFEALILENSLIKRHQPRYNILLKDDKGYPYIRLSREEYPRFSLAGRVAEDGARYFGPYGSRHSTQGILDALRTALRLPSCRKKFPRDIGKERPCLNFHMGKCDGYCRSEELKERHDEAIRQAVSLLEGRFKEVKADLTAEMERAAEELRFEQAAQLRDRLRAIELLGARQKVVAGSLADTDVTGFFRGTAKSCFVVLHYVDGDLAAKDMELLETPVEEDEEEILSSLVREYYGGRTRTRLPRQILLPCELADQVPLTRMLSEQVGSRVELVTPQRGAKMDLIRLANQNAAEEVERATTREERQNKLLEALGRMLGLPEAPRRMESYDISNTGADDIVASMVVFENGAHPALPPVSGRGREVQRPARPASHRRRREPCAGGLPGAGDHGAGHPRLRHGEGRPPPHPGPGGPGRAGDRDPGHPGGVRPHRPDPGGDPPLCHRVQPPAAEGPGPGLCAGPDPRGGGEAPHSAFEAFQERQGHPGGPAGGAGAGGPEEHRTGGLSVFSGN